MSDEHVCDPDNSDCRAYLFYSDPENLRPAGPGRRPERVGLRLTSGAIAKVPRAFLGGQRLTTNTAAHRTRSSLAVVP